MYTTKVRGPWFNPRWLPFFLQFSKYIPKPFLINMYTYMYEETCNFTVSRHDAYFLHFYVKCYGHMIILCSRPLVEDEEDDSEEELSDGELVMDGDDDEWESDGD